MSQVVIYGVAGSDVSGAVTSTGIPCASFRLATNHRFHNRQRDEWVTTPTTWLSVQCYRRLAQNVQTSVHKGDRLVVTGRLSVRDWNNEEKSGREVEIIAETIGPDLRFMTCSSRRQDNGGQRPDAASGAGHPAETEGDGLQRPMSAEAPSGGFGPTPEPVPSSGFDSGDLGLSSDSEPQTRQMASVGASGSEGSPF